MAADRELTFRILTTAETSALDETARALDEVDRAGSKALDNLGDDAKAAATQVDAAMDKIGTSSRTNLRHVDDDARKAGKGLEGFKGEAADSGKEAAQSFSGGFDDITGFVQETAAQAFGGFGAIGAAAGIAGAIGIGVLSSVLTTASDRLNELKSAMLDVQIEGGALGDKVRATLDDLKDNGDLLKLSEDAKMLSVDWQTLIRAMSGSAPDVATITDRMNELSTSAAGVHIVGNEAAIAMDNLELALGRSGVALDETSAEAAAYKLGLDAVAGATDKANKTADDYTSALGRVGGSSDDTATAIEAAATRTAAATKDAKDSWTDYAAGVKISADDIIRVQEEDLAAAAAFQTNMAELYTIGGEDLVNYVTSQGDNAERLAQTIADAPTAKQKEIAANARAAGVLQTTSWAAGVTSGTSNVTDAATTVWESTRKIFGQPVNIPVGVRAPSHATLTGVRNDLAAGMGPIIVDVVLRPKNTALFYQ